MKEFRKYIFAILSVVFFMMAIFLEHLTLTHQPEVKLIQTFRKTLLSQESKLSDYLNDAEKILTTDFKSENYVSAFSGLNHLFEEEGLGLIIFKDQEMVFWSDNHFAFSNLSNILLSRDRLLILPNGIYSVQRRTVGLHELIGLVHIKNNYTYENQFLENKFVAPFDLPSGYKIISGKDKNALTISDLNNEYLFSVLPAGPGVLNVSQLYFPALLYLLGLLFLLFAIYRIVGQYRKKSFALKMLAVLLVLFAIYWIHSVLGIPEILNHFSVFSARYYAVSKWLPSLGDFFLIVVLFFFWSLVFVKEFPRENRLKKVLILPAYFFVLGLYQLIGFTIGNLIRNSNINYKLNQITDIDQFSISSYLAITILLFSVFIIHLKVIQRTEHLIRERLFIQFHVFAVAISVVLCFFIPGTAILILTLFFAVNLLQCQIRKMQISLYSISYSIVFISLFSVISLLLIYQTIRKRDIEVQKLLAINLSSEQDPAAEVFLARMQVQFNTDSIISTLLVPPYKQLENYLTRTYFSGYFRNYDIQYWFCTENECIVVQT